MSTLAATLSLLVRTHRAAIDYRLVSTRVKSEQAIKELCIEAERELPKLSAAEQWKLRAAIDEATDELKASVVDAAREQEMS